MRQSSFPLWHFKETYLKEILTHELRELSSFWIRYLPKHIEFLILPYVVFSRNDACLEDI